MKYIYFYTIFIFSSAFLKSIASKNTVKDSIKLNKSIEQVLTISTSANYLNEKNDISLGSITKRYVLETPSIVQAFFEQFIFLITSLLVIQHFYCFYIFSDIYSICNTIFYIIYYFYFISIKKGLSNRLTTVNSPKPISIN